MKTPVIFIHGLWLHGDSWDSWVRYFTDAGYESQAPGWPGDSATVEETRAHPERMSQVGINEVVAHYASKIESLPQKPIVIGHSFGGLIAQKLLGINLASAAIAIDAAPIKGVFILPFSSLKVASVALRNPLNWSRAVSLTPAQFQYGFTNTLSPGESAELYERWVIPSPGRPLFQAALANFVPNSTAKVNTRNATRGPLLLIAGGKDHTVPSAITHSIFKLYKNSGVEAELKEFTNPSVFKLYGNSKVVTELKEFADRDHSLALNSRWQEVADFSLAWLKKKSL